MDERTRIDQQAGEFFEGLWQRGDHWDLESSAFEQMKYARILALLDGGHYPRVLELGCGAGTLTRPLASIADYVLGGCLRINACSTWLPGRAYGWCV